MSSLETPLHEKTFCGFGRKPKSPMLIFAIQLTDDDPRRTKLVDALAPEVRNVRLRLFDAPAPVPGRVLVKDGRWCVPVAERPAGWQRWGVAE